MRNLKSISALTLILTTVLFSGCNEKATLCKQGAALAPDAEALSSELSIRISDIEKSVASEPEGTPYSTSNSSFARLCDAPEQMIRVGRLSYYAGKVEAVRVKIYNAKADTNGYSPLTEHLYDLKEGLKNSSKWIFDACLLRTSPDSNVRRNALEKLKNAHYELNSQVIAVGQALLENECGVKRKTHASRDSSPNEASDLVITKRVADIATIPSIVVRTSSANSGSVVR